jgi:hypothetical protein
MDPPTGALTVVASDVEDAAASGIGGAEPGLADVVTLQRRRAAAALPAASVGN